MTEFEPKPVTPAPESVAPEAATTPAPKSVPRTTATLVVVLALLAGVLGGLYGALDLAQRPTFQNLFGTGSSGGSNSSQTITVTEESATIEVVKTAGPAVVSIVISKAVSQQPSFGFNEFGFFAIPPDAENSSELQQVGAGTGFFVSSDGWVMTNKHVVTDENASYSVLTNDGKSYEAKVMAVDPANDIALLKIEISDAPYLQFAESSSLQLGQHVIAIGNSLGQYQNTVTSGIVSGIGRSIRAGGGGFVEQLDGVIQTDAAINQGNSGGPLLSLTGLVVGINTAVDQGGQSIGFAIPADDAKSALQSYQQNGKIVRPYLGVRYVMVTESLAKAENLGRDYGALLVSGARPTDFAVIPNSPADKAGLKENDIILELDGKRLDEDNSLAKAIKAYQPGDQVAAKIFRDNAEQTVTIVIGETSP
jgi:serine protease Do